MYILFMTDLLHLEKHQSCSTILIFKFTIFSQVARKILNPHVEDAYKKLETHASYSTDLSYLIIHWIFEHQPEQKTFTHDEICETLVPNQAKQTFSRTILLKHLGGLYFGITVDDTTTISERSFEEIMEFPSVNYFLDQLRNDEESSNFSDYLETDSTSGSYASLSSVEYFDCETEIVPRRLEMIRYFGKQTKESKKFYATNLGCYICELNFSDAADFEEHIKIHKLVDCQKEDASEEEFFEISYRKEDEKTVFTLQTGSENITLERLIFIDKNFEFVNFYEMPMALKAFESYEFTGDLQNNSGTKDFPLFLIYVKESDQNKRIIEHYCYHAVSFRVVFVTFFKVLCHLFFRFKKRWICPN